MELSGQLLLHSTTKKADLEVVSGCILVLVLEDGCTVVSVLEHQLELGDVACLLELLVEIAGEDTLAE